MQDYTLSSIECLLPCTKTGGAPPEIEKARRWLEARSFGASNFKRAYLKRKKPRLTEHVQTELEMFPQECGARACDVRCLFLWSMRAVDSDDAVGAALQLNRYRDAYGFSCDKYERCFQDFCDDLVLQLKRLKDKQAADAVLDQMSQAAVLLWSSQKRWLDADGKKRSELCGMINKVLRDDAVMPMGAWRRTVRRCDSWGGARSNSPLCHFRANPLCQFRATTVESQRHLWPWYTASTSSAAWSVTRPCQTRK